MAKDARGIDDRTNDAGEKGATETKGWKAQLQEIIDANVHKRVNGRVASNRTMEHNATVLFVAFKTMHYKLGLTPLPRNIAERHIRTLARYWYEEGRAAATMRNDLSVLRKFCRWIGKPNLVKKLEEYLPDASPERLTVSATAKVTKSWSANGIDVERKLQEALAIDDRFGMMIAMQLAFGLRRREAIRLRPWVSDQRDLGKSVFIVYDGAKGGKQRILPIEFEFQVWVLDQVKQQIGKRDCLGWKKTIRGKNATLENNIDRYDYYMAKLGISKENCSVCGHGLRAEYAENCALLEGFTPATLGGTGDEMSPEELRIKHKRVSERLGHHRTRVTASYCGSTAANAKEAAAKREAAEKSALAEPHDQPVVNSNGAKGSLPDAKRVDAEERAMHDVSTESVPGDKPESTAPMVDGARAAGGTTQSTGDDKVTTIAEPQGREFFGGYYKNAPAGRKHPDELETKQAKRTVAGDVSLAAGDGERKRQLASAKRPAIDERQLRLPLKDRLTAKLTRGKK
ncbi:integrase domain-containing protein [Paraburkholderia madseniana]|nr:integrase domain-containing protein [Paraburkholderia madseniana]